MKLGDNMTMDAGNMWGDICPRKCRPPRIGDIPKHGAVDEESPGSSTSKLSISSKDESEGNAFLVPSFLETAPANADTIRTTLQRYLPEKSALRTEVYYYARQEAKDTFAKSTPMKPERSCSPSCRTRDEVDSATRVTIKLSPTSSADEEVQFNSRVSSSDIQEGHRIPSSSEKSTPDSEILEVRKDSALFLEETEGLPTLREILRTKPPKIVRPRRESSGYASNLGTFDEDRRNSSTSDVLQDLSSFLKDRRRSSTKKSNSRTTAGKPEENLEEINICGSPDKMPSTSDSAHRKISGTALEMPDIEEVKEGSLTSFQETVHDLCDVIQDISIGSGTPEGRPDSSPPPSSSSSKSIVHQCSTPTISSCTQERMVATESKIEMTREQSVLPRATKFYQLLSTQSEDRSDGEPRVSHRRTSLQIARQQEDEVSPFPDRSQRVSPSKTSKDRRINELGADAPVRKLSSPGEVGATPNFLGDANSTGIRPIYPYCPYSPYGSPQGSPGNRRRPLRESRRVSIDNKQGALQLNQYKLLDNIGQGSYGIVKLAYNEEDETHYAMKILSKKKLMKKAGIFGRMAPGKKGAADPLAKVYREIALLKKLDHPNVVKLVEVLDDPDEDNLYLVFELVQRGEVLQIPTDKPLDEETARKNFRDVVMGVEYLHYQRIVHRDIKPSNLLVDSEGRVKIADLGVSAELRASGELLSGPAGTPAFAAPETTTPGAHYSGTLCDVWSMGVTLYSLVTGRVPWDGAGSIIGVQMAVRSEPLKFPEKPTLSQDLQDIISRMLAKDPHDRTTLRQLKEHPWLTDRGRRPLPTEEDNCRLPVTVTDEEVERVVTRVPKLDTLILIKTMLKQHSFQNPFLPKRVGRNTSNDMETNSLESSASGGRNETSSGRDAKDSKTERFHRAGRSNSAPDSYDWHANRQISVDNPLAPVTEAASQETDAEKR